MALWTKQLKACRRIEVRNREGTILFCKNTENAEKINSPHQLSWPNNVRTAVKAVKSEKNTENAVKINNSPRFTTFTAKRCKKHAVKIIFFHRISPHFIRKFTAKPRPRHDQQAKLKTGGQTSKQAIFELDGLKIVHWR